MMKEIVIGVVTAVTISVIYFLWSEFERVEVSVPRNAVIAFDGQCPSNGWEEYTPAYGRFIRGIDKGTNSNDPDGVRLPGELQNDAFQNHVHTAYMQVGAEPAAGAGGARSTRAAGGHGMAASGSERYETRGLLKAEGGANETRPKNVSLLYCKKIT
jgi:hypothetical protein